MNVQKWEYLQDEYIEEYHIYEDGEEHGYWVSVSQDFKGIVDALNWYGEQGWELVGINEADQGSSYTFKRPINRD